METTLRPLGIVRELVEDLGHEITYAYDDLVFIEHNDFLLKFGHEAGSIELIFNTECPPDDAQSIAALFVSGAVSKGLKLKRNGCYTMSEKPGDSLQITFHPEPVLLS